MKTRYRNDIDRGYAIKKIAHTTDRVLGNNSQASYFTIDTAFARSPKPVWEWFGNQLHPLSITAREVSQQSNPHRFARLVLVHDPLEVTNYWDRSEYCKSVLATIHLHLWHGVVCFVVFGRAHELASLSRLVDFGAIGRDIVFDTSTYYATNFNEFARLEGTIAHEFVRQAVSEVPRRFGKPIKLYYDANTFSGQRRIDAQWQEIREFLIRLYGGVCQGVPFCTNRSPAPDQIEIDHILPLRNSNNVLINLRPLCRACNRYKGSRDIGEDPFKTLFDRIPDEFANRTIQRIISDVSPAWLQRYKDRPKGIAAYIPHS